MHPFRAWLEQHMKEAEVEYTRIQALEDDTETDQDLYERVHQMWGYLAGLEKCLKEFKAHEGRTLEKTR
jgi:hypothetical protein